MTFIECGVLRLGGEFKIIEESQMLLSPFEQQLKEVIFQKLMQFESHWPLSHL